MQGVTSLSDNDRGGFADHGASKLVETGCLGCRSFFVCSQARRGRHSIPGPALVVGPVAVGLQEVFRSLCGAVSVGSQADTASDFSSLEISAFSAWNFQLQKHRS